MILIKQEENEYSIDVLQLDKETYANYDLYINGIKVHSATTVTLPYVFTTPKGLNEIKLILKNSNSSKTFVRCTLDDKDLNCNVVKYLSSMDTKDNILKSNMPYNLFLLLEGTKENSDCDCYCDSLKVIYNEIIKELYNSINCC